MGAGRGWARGGGRPRVIDYDAARAAQRAAGHAKRVGPAGWLGESYAASNGTDAGAGLDGAAARKRLAARAAAAAAAGGGGKLAAAPSPSPASWSNGPYMKQAYEADALRTDRFNMQARSSLSLSLSLSLYIYILCM